MTLDNNSLAKIFEGYDEKISDSSKALEVIMTNIVNHFSKNTDAVITERIVRNYIETTWEPTVWAYLCNLTEQKANIHDWRTFLVFIVDNKVNGNRISRTNPTRDSKELCEINACETEPTEWDHVLPHSWGGPNESWNYKHLCQLHNRMKASSLSMFTRLVRDDPDYGQSFVEWIKGLNLEN